MTVTEAPVERTRANAFFGAWHRNASRASDTTASWIHDQLLDASLEETPTRPARRRLAISTPGVPVVYSHKCTRRSERAAFRMLAEPGGPGTTVAEQIEISRDLLQSITTHLGWQQAADRVDAVLNQLIPCDPETVATWHGGLGFGLEIADGEPELRLYCNVRHGNLSSRWRRFTDAASGLLGSDAEPALRETIDLARGRTVPAGLALAIRDAEVRGFRLYCGLLDRTSDAVTAAAPPGFNASAITIRRFVDSYAASFGGLGEQDVTIGYDFVLRHGKLAPARFKVDLCCENASAMDRGRLVAWLEDQFDTLGIDPMSLRRFFSDLGNAFGEWTIQYVSLGSRIDGAHELAVYCIPGWREARPANPVSARRQKPRELAPEVATAIDHGIAFLLDRRDPGGWWSDFRTLAGPSNEWVSAFVAFALAETRRPVAMAAAREAWSRLRQHRWWLAGWGYNPKVPSDADSTIWASRLAASVGAPPNARAMRFLAKHVTSGGALATYSSDGPIRAFTGLRGISFAGWCGAHPCVTAAGAVLRDIPHRDRLLGWLRNEQQPDGSWLAYWWGTLHYTTALAAEALASAGGPGDSDRLARAGQWVSADLRTRPGLTPFEQALGLRTLLFACVDTDAADFLLGELSRAQRADGSWSPSACLRIPPPDITDPSAFPRWKEGGLGGGSIQVDPGGCYTTATVLLALAHAERHPT